MESGDAYVSKVFRSHVYRMVGVSHGCFARVTIVDLGLERDGIQQAS